jgi:3-oxoacyl-(acyl-carrier-protein) synthase
LNCEDINPIISDLVDEEKSIKKHTKMDLNIIAKSSFGFGAVNVCVIFKKYTGD